ncbi:putative oxidoreductase dhs-27, partial [Aphelenchoides avenae]
IKNVARHLAAFHHYQLCVCKDDLQGLEGFDMCNKANSNDVFLAWSKEFVEYDPEQLRPLVDKISAFSRKDFAEFALRRWHKEAGLPTVLCHGELHRTRMFFYRDEEGKPSNRIAAFVNWESVNQGNPMYDLASHIAFCADAEVRREAETFVVQYYFDEL